MLAALLQHVRLAVRRSPLLHSAFDSLGVLAAGKRLRERLLMRRTYADVTLMGQRLRIAISSRREISRIETFNEQAFVQQMLDSLRPGDVIWDVGANIGLISLLLARRAAELGATIHAFEPEPRNFHELIRNIELNSLGHIITPHQLALSDTEGEVPLSVTGEIGEGSHSLLRLDRQNAVSLWIHTETGSGIAARVDHVPDVVKIDVEGAELRVLRGMETILDASAVREVFVEVHPTRLISDGTSERELESLFEAHSYGLARSIVRLHELQWHYRLLRSD